MKPRCAATRKPFAPGLRSPRSGLVQPIAGADSRPPFCLRLRGEIRCFLASSERRPRRLRLNFVLGGIAF